MTALSKLSIACHARLVEVLPTSPRLPCRQSHPPLIYVVFIAPTSTTLFPPQRSHLITLASLPPLLPFRALHVAVTHTL